VKLRALTFVIVATGAQTLVAVEVDPALPRYESHVIAFPKGASYLTAKGEVAIVGYNDMQEMLAALGARFTALHPEFHFAWDLPGTKAAPAALAAGKSAFAPMGAEMTPPQLAAYEAVTHAPPRMFRVAHASLNPKALSGPLAIFVSGNNPLTSLTCAEAAAIFSGENREAGMKICGVESDAALGIFFRNGVMGGRPFAPDFVGYPQSADVVARIAADAHAIGFAAAMRATPAVKILALASRANEAPVELTEASLVAGRYPLDRCLLIGVRAPVEPWLREFLRFVLSREGQQLIAGSTLGYLPLNANDAATECRKLDARSMAAP